MVGNKGFKEVTLQLRLSMNTINNTPCCSVTSWKYR